MTLTQLADLSPEALRSACVAFHLGDLRSGGSGHLPHDGLMLLGELRRRGRREMWQEARAEAKFQHEKDEFMRRRLT